MDKVKAYAKVNLTLDVLNKRPDGYHDLCGIMHGIDLFDDVYVEPCGDIEMTCTEELPYQSAARRAAEAYRALTGKGVRAHIVRRIPNEAGLGAASADAAGVLRGMNGLYGALGGEELHSIAASIGADVPFCLKLGCALAEGIGDRLTPLPVIPLDLLIVKGGRGVSTAALFAGLTLPESRQDPAAAVRAVRAGDREALAKLMFNALGPAAEAVCPEIADYRERLVRAGALGAVMTGSGSAVLGVFASRERAEAARAEFSDCAFSAVCRTV